MSILDEIKEHCRIGGLIKFEPLGNPRADKIPEAARRRLYISRGIQSFLDRDEPLVAETRADFSDFVLGELVRVALHFNHIDCFMARLERPEDEIWEMRIYDTEPQLRFYGRFAECNVFVALTGPMRKSRLFRRPWDYRRLKQACRAEWDRLFRSAALSKGEDINAYLSSNVDLA